jgi:hypothetical protein
MGDGGSGLVAVAVGTSKAVAGSQGMVGSRKDGSLGRDGRRKGKDSNL